LSENSQIHPVSRGQLAAILLLLLVGCILEAAAESLRIKYAPPATLAGVVKASLAGFLGTLLVGVPLTRLLWNRLLASIFSLPEINYRQALFVGVVLFWLVNI
jgi:hypothetical protein